MLIKKNYLFLDKNLKIYFNKANSKFYLSAYSNVVVLRMPSFYFVKESKNKILLIFLTKFYFYSFYKHVLYLYRDLFNFNFVKLRLKGLGFKVKKITCFLYRFEFDFINFFYFHVPANVIISIKRKRIILISKSFFVLKKVLSHILLLKRLSIYRIKGLIYPRQIIFLKIGKNEF